MAEKFSSTRRRRFAAVVFAAGLWLGWRGTEQAVKASPAVLRKTSINPTENAGVPMPDMESAAVHEREQALLNLLAPDRSRAFSGGELLKLCKQDYVQDLPDGNAAYAYATAWAKQAPEEMNAWFMKRGSMSNLPAAQENTTFGFGVILFTEWAKKNPEEALSHALGWERERAKEEALRGVLTVLLKQDFQKTSAVLREHADLMTGSGGAFPSAYTPADHEVNLKLLKTLPETPARGRLLAKYVRDMLRYDGGAAGEKIWNEAGPELQRELIRGGLVFFPEANRKTAEMMKWEKYEVKLENFEALQREVAESSRDPETARGVLRNQEESWAQRDFPELVKWALTNLRGEDGMERTAELFNHVTAENAGAAESMWRDLPDERLKVEALRVMLNNTPQEVRDRAKALIGELPEREARGLRK